MDSSDRGLKLIGTDRRPRQRVRDEVQALANEFVVPSFTVLFRQRNQVSVGQGSRGAARVSQEHQRKQARHFAVIREQAMQIATETDRLRRQLRALQVGTGARRVALVEDQIEDVQDHAQALRPLVIRRHAELGASRLDARLRPADPLGHGRLGHEERTGDLCRGQATHGAKGERDLRRG